jgi:hypothetical protein
MRLFGDRWARRIRYRNLPTRGAEERKCICIRHAGNEAVAKLRLV